jgi:hypothetical protein
MSGEVTGVVTSVDSESIGEVDGFTVHSESKDYEFVVDPGTEYSFPLAHLQTHLTTSEPVRVVYEDRDGELVALEIADG